MKTEIPVNPTAQAAADMLGFDVLEIANEGKVVAIVSPESADDCLEHLQKSSAGRRCTHNRTESSKHAIYLP